MASSAAGGPWRRARAAVKASGTDRSPAGGSAAGRPAAPAPDEARLRERALLHLAKFESTRAGLARTLGRGIDRWARDQIRAGRDEDEVAAAADSARGLVEPVVARLVAQGVVDDARYAERRSALDRSGGRSARASEARLKAKGVPAALAAAATARDDAGELRAALALLRRRRLGPFALAAFDERRCLAMLARNGFPGAIARKAVSLERDEAEALLAE